MTLFEDARKYLPPYLTNLGQYEMFKNLGRAYPDINYYSHDNRKFICQGDAWTQLELTNIFSMGKIKKVTGLILSNTCDISPDNERIYTTSLTFVPIVKAEKYSDLLIKNGQAAEAVKNHMAAVKSQSISCRFYLPEHAMIDSDYIALLDDTHSLPTDHYLKNSERKAYIKLSNEGFYVFMLKLTIHFCRLFDGVDRNGNAAQ